MRPLSVIFALSLILAAAGYRVIRIDAQNQYAHIIGVALIAAGALGALIAWKRPKDWRISILVTQASLVGTCYLAEAALVFIPDAPSTKPAYTPIHDHRTKREVVNDLRLAGDASVVPMVYPSFAIHFSDFLPLELRGVFGTSVLPLGGISNSTTVLCNESGKWAVYGADEYGFNNPRGTWSRIVDIAVVGDSFSHGNCVQPKEGWVARLRSRFQGVLNLGVGGNGPLFSLATLREYVAPLKPPIVLWQYFEAHDTRIPGEKTLPLLLRYLEESKFRQNLIKRQREMDELLAKIVERAVAEPETATGKQANFSARNFIRLHRLRKTLGLVTRKILPPLDEVTTILRAAKETVDNWNGRFYFVYLPSWYGLGASTPPTHYASHDRVVAAIGELGIEVIDLDPVFRSHHDYLSLFPYRENYHYNADGYALVAKTVANRLAVPLSNGQTK